MTKILIITGGKIDDDFALSFLCKEKFNHIIVVDGALAFWDRIKARQVEEDSRVPLYFDHLVGDFDTIDPFILEKYLHQAQITVHRFIPEKDYTDTDIAVKLAIDLLQGESGRSGVIPQIWLLGAVGSRMDHSLANIQLLSYIKKAGMEGILVDTHNRIRLIEGRIELKKSELFGDFLSLVPLTEKLQRVTLKGFKYEAQDLEVILGETRCVSNEVTADQCTIDIGEGQAFLIEARD